MPKIPKGGTDREVATVYKAQLSFETFRPLSFWERVKILFGRNIEVRCFIATEWKFGKFRPEISVRLTKQQKPLGGEEAYAGYMGTPLPQKNPPAAHAKTKP